MSHPLTCDQLKDKLWCFSRENGAVASDGLLRCQGVHLPDPSITLCLVERKERPRKNLTRLVFAKEIGPDDVAALLGRLAAAG